MNEDLKKFLIFEWRIFLVVGVFWAAAMFLPLLITGALDNKAELLKNILLMCGPYLAYVAGRGLFLFVKSLIWAYVVSNVCFTSDSQKRTADEWLVFNVLFTFWLLLILGLLLLTEGGLKRGNLLLITGVIAFPYVSYLLFRLVTWLLRMAGWAGRDATEAQ